MCSARNCVVWLMMWAQSLLLMPLSAGTLPPDSPSESTAKITTVALRVHRMDAMVDFYREAFGVSFRDVETSGLASRFGELGEITLKLVPLRDGVDFEDYPSHQLGIEVDDVEPVIDLAVAHGGRQHGELMKQDGRMHGAVRDPDGNTIELYSAVSSSDTAPESKN